MSTARAPSGVDVDRAGGLTLTWPDGTSASYGLEELRVNCPCAECRGLRERELPVWPKPTSPQPLRIEDAELIGGWGVTLIWNDGQNRAPSGAGLPHEGQVTATG